MSFSPRHRPAGRPLWPRTAAAVLALALPALRVVAEAPPEKPPELLDAPWRVGPFRLRPLLRLESLGYDSNVFLSSGGERESDFFASLSGGLVGQVMLGDRSALGFQALPSYQIYTRHASQNALGHTLAGRLDTMAGPFGVFVSAASGSAFQKPNNEIDDRTRVRSGRIGGGVGWNATGRLRLAATAAEESLRFANENFEVAPTGECQASTLGDLLDRRERSGSLQASWLVSRTRPFLEYGAWRSAFDRCPGRDARQRSWAGGVLFDPRGALSGTLKGGPARFEPLDPSLPRFAGLLGSVDLSFRLPDRWRMRGRWERRISYSIYEGNLFALETASELGMLRPVSRRLAVEGGVERVRLAWPERVCDPFGACLLRRDTIHRYYVGARFRPAGRQEISLRLGYRWRESSLPGAEETQWVLTTGAEF